MEFSISPMSKWLAKIVAVLLVPCLIVDPSWAASGFPAQFARQNASYLYMDTQVLATLAVPFSKRGIIQPGRDRVNYVTIAAGVVFVSFLGIFPAPSRAQSNLQQQAPNRSIYFPSDPEVSHLTRQFNEFLNPSAGDALIKMGPKAKEAIPAVIERTYHGAGFSREYDDLLTKLLPVTPEVIPGVLELMTDENPRIQGLASSVLKGAPFQPQHVPAMIKILSTPLQSVDSRAPIIDGLGRLGPAAREAVPVLLSALRDIDHNYEYEILIDALVKIGLTNDEFMEALHTVGYFGGNPHIAEKLMETVAGLDENQKKALVPDVLIAVGSPDEFESDTALKVLGRMGPAARSARFILLRETRFGTEKTSASAREALQSVDPGNPFQAISSYSFSDFIYAFLSLLALIKMRFLGRWRSRLAMGIGLAAFVGFQFFSWTNWAAVAAVVLIMSIPDLFRMARRNLSRSDTKLRSVPIEAYDVLNVSGSDASSHNLESPTANRPVSLAIKPQQVLAFDQFHSFIHDYLNQHQDSQLLLQIASRDSPYSATLKNVYTEENRREVADYLDRVSVPSSKLVIIGLHQEGSLESNTHRLIATVAVVPAKERPSNGFIRFTGMLPMLLIAVGAILLVAPILGPRISQAFQSKNVIPALQQIASTA